MENRLPRSSFLPLFKGKSIISRFLRSWFGKRSATNVLTCCPSFEVFERKRLNITPVEQNNDLEINIKLSVQKAELKYI